MTKPKILVIENSIHVTGALKSVTRTAFDLNHQFDFVFVIPKGSKARNWIEDHGFNDIHELRFIEISRRVLPLLLYIPFLLLNGFHIARIVKKEKINLIHVNDLYNLAAVSARLFGCTPPYLTHIRFLPDKFPPFLFNFWLNLHLRFSSKVVCVSHYLKNQLPPNDKIVVIHNELPVEERYPGFVQKHRFPTILYLSNVIKGKGHEFAIEAFSRIHLDFPEWQLRFVGGDMGLRKNKKYREELKALAHKKGIAHRTTWLDFVEDVELEYKKAELVLNFSESESFSITCLEALFFGVPMIATKSGGPAEIIDDKETGLLVANEDVNAMVKSITSLIVNVEYRQTLGRNARERVREKFSIQNTSYRLSNCYDVALRH